LAGVRKRVAASACQDPRDRSGRQRQAGEPLNAHSLNRKESCAAHTLTISDRQVKF
jgi:hypothetical protein